MTKKMNAHPKAISRISHHVKEREPELVLGAIGVSRPVTVGSGTALLVPEETGTATKSERQRPNPGMMLVEEVHVLDTQLPPRKTWLELEHAKQLFGPDPEQLEQLESQD